MMISIMLSRISRASSPGGAEEDEIFTVCVGPTAIPVRVGTTWISGRTDGYTLKLNSPLKVYIHRPNETLTRQLKVQRLYPTRIDQIIPGRPVSIGSRCQFVRRPRYDIIQKGGRRQTFAPFPMILKSSSGARPYPIAVERGSLISSGRAVSSDLPIGKSRRSQPPLGMWNRRDEGSYWFSILRIRPDSVKNYRLKAITVDLNRSNYWMAESAIGGRNRYRTIELPGTLLTTGSLASGKLKSLRIIHYPSEG